MFLGKLSWNKARLDCFAVFVGAVLLERTVNLALLCLCSHRPGKPSSAYRRFQRFLSGFDLPLLDVGRFILGVLPKPKEGFVLVMDRSLWQLGSTPINVLFIGVVFGRMCFPIVWKALPHGGCSDVPARISLLKNAVRVLDGTPIAALLMDREFGGKLRLEHLNNHAVGYVVRIKSNIWIGRRKAGCLAGRGRWKKHAGKRFEVCGQSVYFGAKSMTGQRAGRLLVISNHFGGADALAWYRLRWNIELSFGHLKSRGLNMEATHVSKPARIERLCAVVAVAFVIAYRNGVRIEQKRAIQRKKHGYCAKSVFRAGLEQIISALMRADVPLLREMFCALKSPWPLPPAQLHFFVM